MTNRLLIALGISSVCMTAMGGVQSFYCPQNHGYINVGMSPDQVIGACGEPLSKQQSNQPITQRVPVQQLIFNAVGGQKAFYGVLFSRNSLPIVEIVVRIGHTKGAL